MLIVSDFLVTAIRVFDIIILTLGAGLAIAMAVKLKTEKYRRFFLLAFGLMSLGVTFATFQKVHHNSPWNWATTPFIFMAAVLILVTMIVAIRDHFK